MGRRPVEEGEVPGFVYAVNSVSIGLDVVVRRGEVWDADCDVVRGNPGHFTTDARQIPGLVHTGPVVWTRESV